MRIIPVLGALVLFGLILQIILGFAGDAYSSIHIPLGFAGMAFAVLFVAAAFRSKTTTRASKINGHLPNLGAFPNLLGLYSDDH